MAKTDLSRYSNDDLLMGMLYWYAKDSEFGPMRTMFLADLDESVCFADVHVEVLRRMQRKNTDKRIEAAIAHVLEYGACGYDELLAILRGKRDG